MSEVVLALALCMHNTSLLLPLLLLPSLTFPPSFLFSSLPPSFLLHTHLLPLFLLSSSLPPSQNHIGVCVYRVVTCPNKGCEAVLPYNQLESHEQNCSFRRVTCEHCHIEITISQLEVRKRRSWYNENRNLLN